MQASCASSARATLSAQASGSSSGIGPHDRVLLVPQQAWDPYHRLQKPCSFPAQNSSYSQGKQDLSVLYAATIACERSSHRGPKRRGLIFAVIDLEKACKTAVTTPFSLSEFLGMLLNNAKQTLQRTINHIRKLRSALQNAAPCQIPDQLGQVPGPSSRGHLGRIFSQHRKLPRTTTTQDAYYHRVPETDRLITALGLPQHAYLLPTLHPTCRIVSGNSLCTTKRMQIQRSEEN